MKCLSIRQPWAWAIFHLKKNIENRTWSTSYRGPLLIHAGKGFDEAGQQFLLMQGFRLPCRIDFSRGGIVGIAELIGCVKSSSSSWFEGPYGLLLRRARSLLFFSYPGKPGLFEVHPPARLIPAIQDWFREGKKVLPIEEELESLAREIITENWKRLPPDLTDRLDDYLLEEILENPSP